jgi:hypothetical protein
LAHQRSDFSHTVVLNAQTEALFATWQAKTGKSFNGTVNSLLKSFLSSEKAATEEAQP